MEADSSTQLACGRMGLVGKQRKRTQKSWIQYRYVLILMGFWGLTTVYGMRVNINVAMVVMVNQSQATTETRSSSCPVLDVIDHNATERTKRDGPFNWDRYTQGLILGSFFYGYILTPIPGGRLAERFGAKWFFGIGTLLTGLLSLMIPTAAYRWGAEGVIIIRVLQGLGEGVTYPAMEAQVAHWFPVGERTTGIALIHTGGFFGIVTGMAISGILADSNVLGGWPSVFYFFGVLSLIWFLFWALLVSNRPEDHPWISQEELDLITNDLANQKPTHASSTPWKLILKSPVVIAVACAQFGSNWLQHTLITELPTYLGTVLHFNIKDNGIYSALPYIGAILSGAFAGPIADYIRRNKYMTSTNVRKLFNGMACFGPAVILVLFIWVAGCNSTISLTLLVMAGTLRGFAEAGYMSAPVDMAPDYAGTILGITVCLSQTTGFLVPWTTGAFIKEENTTTTWSHAFYLTAAVGTLGGLIFQIFGSAEIQEWGLAHRNATKNSQKTASVDDSIENDESVKVA